ncbi:glycosyl hydrolase family 18 protein, partial [Saccharothrix sp. ST-888]|uniref:glycosyl hydrolase family 18 protein n=1 Tax=Saccharothrix sp. ST-888 TaxID=1427391 RepID=UPI0005EBF6FD
WSFTVDVFAIDLEYPCCCVHTSNHASPANKQNFTALMAEFRSELDAQGSADKNTYAVSAAVAACTDKTKNTETDKPAEYLTFLHVMTYDLHYAWHATRPTNHQAPIDSG